MTTSEGKTRQFSSTAYLVMLAAGGVAVLWAWFAIIDPTHGPDSGYRVFFGERPVVKLGNRIWLPFLQTQIWLYHLLGLPIAGLKLITVFYFAMGLLCLGLYWRQFLGSDVKASLLGAFAVICFATQPLPRRLSELMQEQTGFGLLFLFVWLASRDRPLPMAALAIGFVAMLTRDSYWFYLLACTLVDLRSWPWGKRRLGFYAGLWAAPAIWLCLCVPLIYLVAYGRLPQLPIEWPLMYNPSGHRPTTAETLESLRSAVVGSGVAFVALGVAAAAFLLLVWHRGRFLTQFDSSPFASSVIRSAPVALAIVYGLILAIDPWQETPGDRRPAWPLLEISFVVAPVLIRAALPGPAWIRYSVIAVILGGMLMGGWRVSGTDRWRKIKADAAELSKLPPLLDSAGNRRQLSVCMMAKTRWDVFRQLSGLTFYNRATYLPPNEPLPGHCRFLIVEEKAITASGHTFEPPGEYVRLENINTGEFRWTVFENREASNVDPQ